jgi:hypothetical protein
MRTAAPWALVIGLLAVVLYVGRLTLGWPLIHDAPLMHYIAWRISEGAVPYRDLFDMNFPGVYLLHLLALTVLGEGGVGWRTFDLAWLALAALGVAALAAPWGRVAAAGGALCFAAYHLRGGAWQAGQRDFLLCPFLLGGALGVARWHERRETSALWLAGLALGAGVMVKPHAVLFVAAMLALVVATARGDARWRSPAVFAAGLVIVPGAIVGWMAAIGGLRPWWDIVFGYLVPLYSKLGRSAATWGVVYERPLWPVIALALALSLGHACLARRLTFRHLVVVTGLAYGLVHYFGQGKGWEYHLYPLAAFASVLLFSEITAALRSRASLVGAPLYAALVALVVLLGWNGVIEAHTDWVRRKERVVTVLTEDLDARLRRDDTVQVLDTTDGGVHALYRLGLVQPTRFIYDFHFFHDTSTPTIQALRAELVGGLERRPPRLIVLFRRGWPGGREERIAGFPELARILAQRYVIAVDRRDYVIYAKRDDS